MTSLCGREGRPGCAVHIPRMPPCVPNVAGCLVLRRLDCSRCPISGFGCPGDVLRATEAASVARCTSPGHPSRRSHTCCCPASTAQAPRQVSCMPTMCECPPYVPRMPPCAPRMFAKCACSSKRPLLPTICLHLEPWALCADPRTRTSRSLPPGPFRSLRAARWRPKP